MELATVYLRLLLEASSLHNFNLFRRRLRSSALTQTRKHRSNYRILETLSPLLQQDYRSSLKRRHQHNQLLLTSWISDKIAWPKKVILPGLPVGYWSTEALNKLTTAIGRPLHTNKFTAEMDNI
ncbi:uncharacterized protein LOC132642755 [Lycium barbarum]|uniref:uncharacterized protein LOC132642755 n=1 Tax=Lycium barbarum TaxID=112863 RepID=UPI00293EEC29|nr:uncharacterized protein LOC132642755 [Lycium barbarum]